MARESQTPADYLEFEVRGILMCHFTFWFLIIVCDADSRDMYEKMMPNFLKKM